ncbi:ArsR/SmtB family transcription factor [Gordonia sp. 852002-51296_SCH5728562-b]|uniref:ArsR/SmtB family transcription factor n=1 Tax=Gordonia sp. 852002-51296_SCH5728562-b TaxID=1834101 RepID=UPI0007EBD91F|nr:winged helix-turn-helix domain-containing protein [Gordonia sp. 852002-51296_SCH5728562-b]OBA38142.1 transcriptional regulator [Gordonia sp. 852002-51296_SCH5728562-b]
MTHGQASTGDVDDALWSAIGDPTRRRIVDLLLAGDGGTATSLSEQLPVSRQGVAKHLGVLDRAGLVHATPAGRERRYDVNRAQLAKAAAQLESVGAAWDARLHRIKGIAEALQHARNRSKTEHQRSQQNGPEQSRSEHKEQGST